MKKNQAQRSLNKSAETIGAAIMAGIAGTIAITISQMIEMKITDRKAGTGAANAVEKTLQIYPQPGTKKRFTKEIHWVYGTSWGLVRGLLSAFGINKWVATAIHFGAITGAAMAIAPLEGQPPVKEWTSKKIGIDLLHHAVYALITGCVFDAIVNDKIRRT